MNYEAHKYQLLLKYTNTIYVYFNTDMGSLKALLPRKSNTHYIEFVSVALVIQHATRMRRTILSYAASLTVPYISTLPLNSTTFEKKLLNIKCVF
jgi:hypothetical protein